MPWRGMPALRPDSVDARDTEPVRGDEVLDARALDSDTDRFTVDNRVDERALRELYLAPFEAVVADADPWMVMAAYNKVNGTSMTENDLLAEPLKGEWGFDGVVVSDWGAVYDGEPAALAALAEGRVWEIRLAAGEQPELPKESKVVDQVPEAGGGVRLRVLCASQPHPAARSTEPVIEDGYLKLVNWGAD